MLAMNSNLSQSANNDSGTAYRRNQVKSCCFLGILFLSLLIALVLSLRAGSYNTPIAELVKGIFGKAADDKINLVVPHGDIVQSNARQSDDMGKCRYGIRKRTQLVL